MYSKKLALLMLLAVLVSCGRRNVKVFPLLDPSQGYHKTNDGLTLSVKKFTRQETIDYFGVDLLLYGYRPLQVMIHNTGDSTFVLRPSYIDLPLVSGKRIAKLMHYDTYSNVMWSSMPALLFWWPAIPCFVAPAGFGMREYNRKITKNLKNKSLNNKQVLKIVPYETISKFMFVYESHYRPNFDISFLNKDTKELLNFTIIF